MSNTLNLDAKRAARAAARGEPMRMVLDGQTFDLVAEMPIEIGELAADNKIPEALRLMLANAEADWSRLLACKPSFNDVLDVVAFFGAALGESVQSAESSTSTGRPSKQTSSTTTGETSRPTATAGLPLTPVA